MFMIPKYMTVYHPQQQICCHNMEFAVEMVPVHQSEDCGDFAFAVELAFGGDPRTTI